MRLSTIFLTIYLAQGFAREPEKIPGNLSGNCPNNFEYIKDIDKNLIQGVWYGQYQTNSTLSGCDGTCWTLYVARVDETSTLSSICCQKDGEPFCGKEVGSVITENIETPARNVKGLGPFYYLYMNYEEVAVGFFCEETYGLRVFVYTRTPSGPKELEEKVFQLLKENNIDPKGLVKIPHGDKCNYRL